MPEKKEIFSCGIIGAGKLGTALAEKMSAIGKLSWVTARSDKSYNNVKNFNAQFFRDINEIDNVPDLILITVNDSAIEDVSNVIAEHLTPGLEEVYVAHCSGALNRDVLSACAKKGARTASIHPYQTFYIPSQDDFKGIAWGLECDQDDCSSLSDFIIESGGKPVVLPQEIIRNKALYHCSAVAASNFITTVNVLAKKMATMTGVSPDLFLPPIMRTTIENNIARIGEKGHNPLTGPIARGDHDTVKKHLEALIVDNHLLNLYCYMGLATAETALYSSLISKKDYKDFSDLFEQYLKKSRK